MKKLIIMLIIGSLFAQNNPNTSANEIDNPCEDKIFLKLKEKKLDEMTDGEYDYFSQKSTECATLLSFSYSKVKYLNQIRFGQNFTTNNQDRQMAEYERNKIILELKTYLIDKEKERLYKEKERLLRQESLACSMKFIMGSYKLASYTYKLVKQKSRCNGK
jgi:hypothetical protein